MRQFNEIEQKFINRINQYNENDKWPFLQNIIKDFDVDGLFFESNDDQLFFNIVEINPTGTYTAGISPELLKSMHSKGMRFLIDLFSLLDYLVDKELIIVLDDPTSDSKVLGRVFSPGNGVSITPLIIRNPYLEGKAKKYFGALIYAGNNLITFINEGYRHQEQINFDETLKQTVAGNKTNRILLLVTIIALVLTATFSGIELFSNIEEVDLKPSVQQADSFPIKERASKCPK